jgi:hypothetical protein
MKINREMALNCLKEEFVPRGRMRKDDLKLPLVLLTMISLYGKWFDGF